MIRCRFAPSPTGYLHVGGARTALFNYLFARSHGGKHILRIEDTDEQRSSQEAVDAITQGLQWLNIEYDEGPFFQSDRKPIYQSYAAKLLQLGAAYPCYCTAEELEAMREEQRQKGLKPQYDRRCRPAEPTPLPPLLPTGKDERPFVIRLRVPETGVTVFEDLVLDTISTSNEELDDFILVRSDGTVTYNFAVVVDDIDMQISHIIRGMDHVSNTPKQIVIYQALQSEPPKFAHVPMILGPDKQKLSKRHGATSVIEYKKEGYLPDAFLNYLVRLGWSHGDQEIFSRAELEKFFDLDHVNKSAAVFDRDKLVWVNSEHIKSQTPAQLAPQLAEFLTEDHSEQEKLINDPRFLKLIASLQERAKTLVEMAAACKWFVQQGPVEIDSKARESHLTTEAKALLRLLVADLQQLENFEESSIERCFQSRCEQSGVKLVKLAQPVRVAITGSTVSPPIFTVLEVLGKKLSLERIELALKDSNLDF